MQCKDIPDQPILHHLMVHGGIGCTWFGVNARDVNNAMPEGTPDRLVLAKMRMLIRRGLVEGCGCGCRGDFDLTDKGRDSLKGRRE